MPFIALTKFNCHYLYEDFGHQQTLVLCNSLGTNLRMWEDNIDELSHHFNILRFDQRGHGQSSINHDTLSIADLAEDVIELVEQLSLKNLFFCGLSIGGLIGQWLGINYPQFFNKIIISNTAAKIGTAESWASRIQQVKHNGLGSILQGTADRWFTTEYRVTNKQKVDAILDDFEANTLRGYMACCHALASADLSSQLHKIEIPLLIIAGDKDQVTTVQDAQFIQKKAGLTHLITLDAAHLASMEHPREFAKHIIHFIQH